MKKLYRKLLIAAVFAAAAPLQAAPSFSGAVGGSAGVDIDIPLAGSGSGFKVPLAGFAAVQANLAEWCVARGEIAINASNFEFDDIFGSAQSAIKLNELSLVLIRRAVTASSFFSAFLGSYEQIGSDTFLMRQFGIEPISSPLSKSATNLAGTSVLPTRGAGLSYIVNFDKAPIATGAYIYLGKDKNKDWTLNFDVRFSFVSNLATLDFLAGVGAPLQNTFNNEDVVLMIDTIYLRGGINLLLGSKYTHSLFVQAGLNDVVVKGDEVGTITGDMLNFLAEPRINFDKFRFSLTAYAYNSDTVKDLIYLQDEFGAAVTFYKDDIETKSGFLTLGAHAIASCGGRMAADFLQDWDTEGLTYNAYLTPYMEIQIGPTARFEAMAQFGVCDLAGSQTLNLRFIASARKNF